MTTRKPFLVVIFFIIYCSAEVSGQTWVHKTFEDFSKGTLDASGQNIYVSSKGAISTIRRFDLNNDGFIDLLFNSTHDDDVAVPASITTMSPGRQMQTKPMQVEGSLGAAIADLNRDGYPDVVFCPNATGVQAPNRYLTIIYGGADGWPPERSNGLLPVNDVKGIVIADLNGDGWPDIVTLNSKAWLPGQPAGNIARVYWGGQHGYMLTRFQDIGVGDGFHLVSGDFDSDGIQDVAVLTENNFICTIWGKKQGSDHNTNNNKQKEMKPGYPGIANEPTIDFKKTEFKLPGKTPLCIAAGDLNANGRIDILVGSDNDSLYILNGQGKREWNILHTVPGVNTSFITVGDVDGDGSADLVVSRFSVLRAAGGEMIGAKSSEDTNIKILWGNKGKFSVSATTNLDAPFTAASVIIDFDGDGNNDIICANYQGKTTYNTESIIYFGTGNRTF